MNRESRGAGESGTSRPKLLFLCQMLPYPPDGGPEIRTYNILRILARTFDITALCFYRRETRRGEQVQRAIEGLSDLAHVEAFPIPQEHSRGRLLWDHLRSVVSGAVYTRFAYTSTAYAERLHEVLREQVFDLVHVDSLDLSAYLPRLHGMPIACTHHNVESELLERRAQVETSSWRKRYLRLQARLMEREERKWCGTVALNITVSEADARSIRVLVPGARVIAIPNGVDTSKFTPGDGAGSGLVFVGGYNWLPNRDAMEYFAEEILPFVRQDAPDLPITWVGRSPPAVAQRFQQTSGIRLTGYVDDIRPYVQGSACYIVPLRVGGGSRLKILDAWAMGMAVVSTAVGCEGLDARDGDNIIVRDEPAAFAAAVLDVVRDAELRARIGASARRTAEERYDWEVLGEYLMAEYSTLLQGERADSHQERPTGQRE